MKPAVIIAVVVLLAALVWLALSWQSRLEVALPPREVAASQADALQLALLYAASNHGTIRPILGTGSMSPFIPAAAVGLDPRTTIVAYAVTDSRLTFADVREGALCVYVAPWAKSSLVIHQASARDADGWIMTGLNNRRYENWMRLTPENFVGITTRVFMWEVISRPR